MLIEFSVTNYLSFRDKVTFSMLASDDTGLEESNVIQLPTGERCLKSAAIYGANAAGKSNFIKAIDYMSLLVYSSAQKTPGEPIDINPFRLADGADIKPSAFDVVFFASGVKYAYGITFDSTNIIEEYLYYFENDKQRTIFERMNITEYNFTDEYGANDKIDIGVQEYFKRFTANNKLYLSVAVMLDYTPVKDAFAWLTDMYTTGVATAYNIIVDAYFGGKGDKPEAQKIIDTAIEWVKDIDTGIKDITFEENPDLFKDDYVQNGNFTTDNFVKVLNNTITTHDTIDNNGVPQQVKFKFYTSESQGTRMFFMMAICAAQRARRGGIIIVDELDDSLHTKVAAHMIKLFHSLGQGAGITSQLIFTTHDTNLLDNKHFRRDQIWFAEKNPTTGATELFSLCDFEQPDNADAVEIEKGYLMGIYGAIPFIKGDVNA